MKKLVKLGTLIVIGAVITTIVDDLIGVKEALNTVPQVAKITHIVVLGLWGAAIAHYVKKF